MKAYAVYITLSPYLDVPGFDSRSDHVGKQLFLYRQYQGILGMAPQSTFVNIFI